MTAPRAIFLDFDGPLHPTSAIEGLQAGVVTIGEATRQRQLFRWLPQLVEIMAAHEDVGIVVHSAWRRFASNSELRESLGPLGDRYLGITPLDKGVERYDGILQVVERFGIEHYLIIDDAVERFPQGLKELCPVDPDLGLSEERACADIRAWLQETALDRPWLGDAPSSVNARRASQG